MRLTDITYLKKISTLRTGWFLLFCTYFCMQTFADEPNPNTLITIGDTITITETPIIETTDSMYFGELPSFSFQNTDSLEMPRNFKVRTFIPNPNRAVWLSALFPGLGQVYNRRYWKLPIVVGGFMGIAYALDWNNRMLTDYTLAYGDITDNDPSTKRYLDFFPSYIKEEDLDPKWLENILKSRKDFYRRNRDLSIICLAGMYLLCMLDAYVDASLSHFDISPDLSMDISPTMLEMHRNGLPSFGIQWAFNF